LVVLKLATLVGMARKSFSVWTVDWIINRSICKLSRHQRLAK